MEPYRAPYSTAPYSTAPYRSLKFNEHFFYCTDLFQLLGADSGKYPPHLEHLTKTVAPYRAPYSTAPYRSFKFNEHFFYCMDLFQLLN